MPANIPAKIKRIFQDRRRVIVSGALVLILALGAFLRFYQLGANDIGNQYYAATVKSMLTSWHNFFYASFEPGGSVSVDKPPLGFWLECLSAYFLGVTGFALALPNAIAGVLSIFVVYKLVRRPFGPGAGLAAALALAVMPVAISTERNNTIDGLLVFVLLLAAWAFLQSVYTGKARWLFIGAFIVGLGFNIKMLQAFLPLPAFYAIYFFGTKTKWWKRILNLSAATALLLVISLSWVMFVDLTPASARPYVGSSTDNTEMELIVGHNGIRRFTNLFGRQDDGPQNAPAARTNPPQGTRPPLPPLPNGNRPGQFQPGQNRAPGTMDFGTAGTLRLFTDPLVGEASWLLPFVLSGLFVIVAVLWKQPFDGRHAALILWAGWLLPEAVYFTYSQGLMHAYYLIMMGPSIAALFAMTGWVFWQIIRKRAWGGWAVTSALAAATLIFEAGVLKGTNSAAPWAVGAAAVLLLAGIVLMVVSRKQVRFAPAALALILAALLVAPMLWSALTTFNTSVDSALPYAGPSRQSNLPRLGQGADRPEVASQALVDYLLVHTEPDAYLLATYNANQAAPFILATGRPVLTFGGFLGSDNIIDADGLAQMVAEGKLRFVLGGGGVGKQEITSWIEMNCAVVLDVPGLDVGPGDVQNNVLYDCRR